MKFYSVFVVVPKTDRNKVRISDFTTEKTVEVLTFGASHIHYDVAKMLRAHVIVTVGEWHEDEDCKKAIQVARIMGKEVIHESKFQEYAEANNY